jgi:hypothetical protein
MEEVNHIIKVGVSGKDPHLCQNWRKHWDHQLFKVVEHQFRKSCIAPNLTKIKLEIVFQNKQVMHF